MGRYTDQRGPTACLTRLPPIDELEQLDAFHPSPSLETETKLHHRHSRDRSERSAWKSKVHSPLRTSSHKGKNAHRAEPQVGSARRVVQAAHHSAGASHEADLRIPPPLLSPIELNDEYHSCPSGRGDEHLHHLQMCVNRFDDELVAARNAARGSGKSLDGVTARRAEAITNLNLLVVAGAIEVGGLAGPLDDQPQNIPTGALAWQRVCRALVSGVITWLCALFPSLFLVLGRLGPRDQGGDEGELPKARLRLRICERADRPPRLGDSGNSISAFATVEKRHAGRADLVLRCEEGSVLARLELCELGVVAVGELMVALVDVPSMRMSPASRKLALENAAIIWFYNHSLLATFMDMVRDV